MVDFERFRLALTEPPTALARGEEGGRPDARCAFAASYRAPLCFTRTRFSISARRRPKRCWIWKQAQESDSLPHRRMYSRLTKMMSHLRPPPFRSRRGYLQLSDPIEKTIKLASSLQMCSSNSSRSCSIERWLRLNETGTTTGTSTPSLTRLSRISFRLINIID